MKKFHPILKGLFLAAGLLFLFSLSQVHAQTKSILVYKLNGTTPSESTITISEPGNITEGFKVKLSPAPTGTVKVTVAVTGSAPLTIIKGGTLTFTASNTLAQTDIQVGTVKGGQTGSISFSASGYPTTKIAYTVGTVTDVNAGSGVTADQLPGSTLSLDQLFTTILQWLLTALGFAAFIGVVYSGFLYITAGGDSAQAEKARKNLTWAIIGVILASLSLGIVRYVISAAQTLKIDSGSSSSTSNTGQSSSSTSSTNTGTAAGNAAGTTAGGESSTGAFGAGK